MSGRTRRLSNHTLVKAINSQNEVGIQSWVSSPCTQANHGSTNASRMQGQKRRKAAKMVAVVIWLFATCWLPIHIVQLWMTFDPEFPRTEGMYVFKIVAHALSYANSCVNPVVYSFLGDGFRKAVRKAFPRFFKTTNDEAKAAVSSTSNVCTRRPKTEDPTGSCSVSVVPQTDSAYAATQQHLELTVRRDVTPKQARILARQMSLPGTCSGQRSNMLSAVEEVPV